MEHPTSNQPDSPSNTLTILNAKQAAELLGVHFSTVYEAAQRGEIPCRRIRRRYVFVRETLEQWLLSGGLGENQRA